MIKRGGEKFGAKMRGAHWEIIKNVLICDMYTNLRLGMERERGVCGEWTDRLSIAVRAYFVVRIPSRVGEYVKIIWK